MVATAAAGADGAGTGSEAVAMRELTGDKEDWSARSPRCLMAVWLLLTAYGYLWLLLCCSWLPLTAYGYLWLLICC